MRYVILLHVMVCWVLTSLVAQGQTSVVLHHDGSRQIGVEYLKPSFSQEEVKYSFLSSVWFVSGRFPVGPRVTIVADIPVSHADPKDQTFSNTRPETMIGNPYIGVEIKHPDTSIHGGFGVRIPLASSDKPFSAVYAFFGDFHRFEAFSADLVPLNLMFGYREIWFSGLYANALLGATTMISTDTSVSPETFLDLEALLGYDRDEFRLAGGVASRIIATESAGNLKERSISTIILQASFVVKQIRPGIFSRVPLDEDLRDFLDVVFGFTLVVDLDG